MAYIINKLKRAPLLPRVQRFFLDRLLRQLLGQPGVTPDLVVVSVDGASDGAKASMALTEVLGLRHVAHRNEPGTASYASSKISR